MTNEAKGRRAPATRGSAGPHPPCGSPLWVGVGHGTGRAVGAQHRPAAPFALGRGIRPGAFQFGKGGPLTTSGPEMAQWIPQKGARQKLGVNMQCNGGQERQRGESLPPPPPPPTKKELLWGLICNCRGRKHFRNVREGSGRACLTQPSSPSVPLLRFMASSCRRGHVTHNRTRVWGVRQHEPSVLHDTIDAVAGHHPQLPGGGAKPCSCCCSPGSWRLQSTRGVNPMNKDSWGYGGKRSDPSICRRHVLRGQQLHDPCLRGW